MIVAASTNPGVLEHRITEIGVEIFERAAAAQPYIWQQAWWQRFLIDLSSHYEQLKVQAFRFVDVLPVLKTDADIARHIQQYLDIDRYEMPLIARTALGFRDVDSMHAKAIVSAARFGAKMMAQSFIAGSNADEAIASVLAFRRQRMAFTLDVLGEFTTSETQADRYLATYLDLIDSLCPAAVEWQPNHLIDHGSDGPMPRVNISIKLTGLSPHFDAIDPERAFDSIASRLRPILRRARDLGAFINIDMESFGYRDITYALFKRLLMEDEFRDMTDIGIVVQAYLTDGERDYEDLLQWVIKRGRPIAIRLVKGAYWDMETALANQNNVTPPVWQQKWESDACFERIATRMLQNHRHTRPAFASHNVRSIAHAMATAEQLGLSPHDYEIQMLNGMGDPLKKAIVDLGCCLRVYTPYGDFISGMGYLIRRLLENTANDSFLRQSYNVRDAASLLVNPAISRPTSAPARQSRFQETTEDEAMSEFHNEPIYSFSNEQHRSQYSAALDYVRGELGGEHPLVIDGKTVRTSQWITSTNPVNPSEIIGKVSAATTADVDHAVASAARALPAWRQTAPEDRIKILRDVADAIRQRRFEFNALLTLEAGKPWREADADVAEALDYLDYYAECMAHMTSRLRRRDLPGEDNYVVYEPKGVCVVLATWSFPLALLTNQTAAALVTGNSVVMKPASHTPVIAAKLFNLFRQAGVPDGVLNFLPGRGSEIGQHIVTHPDVSVISFTGTRHAGIDIRRWANDVAPNQRHIKKVISELGGKNAIIVDNSADLDEAVAGVIKSTFGYSGQKCTACSRAIVLESVYDDFCDKLVDAVRSLAIGPAEQPATIIAPLIHNDLRDMVRGHITQAKSDARLIYETAASDLPDRDLYIGPTIFADVSPDSALAQEEVFGPVLAVLKANDFDNALDIANDTPYALTGGLYSRTPNHIEQTKRGFRVGNLYINRKITGSRVDIEPFGGLKMSGDGAKVGGPDYLHHYCDVRTITEHTLRHGLAPATEVESKV